MGLPGLAKTCQDLPRIAKTCEELPGLDQTSQDHNLVKSDKRGSDMAGPSKARASKLAMTCKDLQGLTEWKCKDS